MAEALRIDNLDPPADSPPPSGCETSPNRCNIKPTFIPNDKMSPSFISTIRTAMKRSKSTWTAPTPTPIFCNYTPPTRPTATVVQPQLRASLNDESAQPTPDVLILRSFRRMSYTQTAHVHEPLW
ncbi:hypothetical protein DFH06DRAFT_1330218 [Mycena polygramma]|nr:hypothetical protein DFH06DRAFT_1330218 [Mycena polygramma]